MAINASGYLNHIKEHLNIDVYGKTYNASDKKTDEFLENKLLLAEKMEDNTRKAIRLNYKGEAFAVKLDIGNNPLFHFLDNDGHPWSKRCDFVIFQSYKNKIKVYCIEFKIASTVIPVDRIALQLKATESWCRSLSEIIKSYQNIYKKMYLSKYVFTASTNPAPDLGSNCKYLRKHSDIRHYLFDEVDEIDLEELENTRLITV